MLLGGSSYCRPQDAIISDLIDAPRNAVFGQKVVHKKYDFLLLVEDGKGLVYGPPQYVGTRSNRTSSDGRVAPFPRRPQKRRD